MATEQLRSATNLLALIRKCDTIINRTFKGMDTAEDKIVNLSSLRLVYKTLNETLQGLKSWIRLFDSATQTIIVLHAKIVRDNFQTSEKLEAQEKEKIASRVPIGLLKADAVKINAFLSTTVAPMLKEIAGGEGEDKYVYANSIPPNPPRLTLDYNDTSTCEGRLKAAVLEDSGSRVSSIVALGMGGVGKTCALRGLAHDHDVKERFSDGILYVQLGADATISTIIDGIATMMRRTGSSLADKVRGSITLQAAVDEASIWFRPHTCLFLIDDIWSVNGIDSTVFYALETMANERSRLVYTTRHKNLAHICDRSITFSPKETHGDLARNILLRAGYTSEEELSEKDEAAVMNILEACQGLPLALGVAGGTVRKAQMSHLHADENAWMFVSDRIEDIFEDGATGYVGVEQIVDASLSILESSGENVGFSRMFRALCVLEKQQRVPINTLRHLWNMKNLQDAMDVVNHLDEVSIVRQTFHEGNVYVQLNNLILDIANRKAYEAQEVKDIFRQLIDNYIAEDRERRVPTETESAVESSTGAFLPQPHMQKRTGLVQCLRTLCCLRRSANREASGESKSKRVEEALEVARPMWEWWKCEDDGYIHDNVCRLLKRAGYEEEVLWLLSRPLWIVSRLQNGGIYAIERDVKNCRKVAGSDSNRDEAVVKHIEMVRKAARMGCTYVNNNKSEAWFQLHGRLLWYAERNDVTKLFVEEMEECAPRPWAKASAGLLQQAGTVASDIVPVHGTLYSVQADDQGLAFCWRDRCTIGLTQYRFVSGLAETKEKVCHELGYESSDSIIMSSGALSKDFRMVVIGVSDGTILIWETTTGRTNRSRRGHNGPVQCVAISADASLIATGSWDRTVRTWKMDTGELVGIPLIGHSHAVLCVAISEDGRHVVSGSRDNTVRMWDTGSGKPVGQPLIGHTDWVQCVACSPDGARVVSGSDDMTVRVWDVRWGRPVGQPLVGHTDAVTCVAWSADGELVVSGSNDRTVRVWRVSSGRPIEQPLVGHKMPVLCVTFVGERKRVVSGSRDKSVRVLDVDSGGPVEQPLFCHTDTVQCAARSADGRYVASGSRDNSVRLWEVSNGEQYRYPLVGHQEAVLSVSWSLDGNRIVSGSRDKTVRVWEVESGELVGEPLVGHDQPVVCVAWSTDGRHIASCSLDQTAVVWEVGSGKPVGERLIGHKRAVLCVAWSTDGKNVVTGSRDKTVRVWEAGSLDPVRCTFVGHTAAVLCVSWSEDGRRVVSGSEDMTVRVWEVGSGELVGPPLAHESLVSEVAVNQDGSLVVSYEWGGLGRVWNVKDGECIKTSRNKAWSATLRDLQQQGLSMNIRDIRWWRPASEVTYQARDGSEVVLGTCENNVERFGESWFSEANFAHCKVIN